jgi:hypothetical protein
MLTLTHSHSYYYNLPALLMSHLHFPSKADNRVFALAASDLRIRTYEVCIFIGAWVQLGLAGEEYS